LLRYYEIIKHPANKTVISALAIIWNILWTKLWEPKPTQPSFVVTFRATPAVAVVRTAGVLMQNSNLPEMRLAPN
jgi:hypothetical protein